MSVDGKAILVTGAASGLGRATARLLAERGARVTAFDRDAERLAELDAELGCETIVGNVTVQRDVVAATSGRGFDVVVNNAGILDGLMPAGEVTDAVWDHVLAVNLTGPLRVARSVIPEMESRGAGVILNVASAGGLRGGRAGAAYTASKWGLIGLTQNIAALHGPNGIRANAICPGSMTTRIAEGMTFSEAGAAALGRVTGAFDTVDPERVARVVVLLAGDDAAHVNGAAVPVDGGWIAS